MPIENRYQPPAEERERVIMIDEEVGGGPDDPIIEPARNIPSTERHQPYQHDDEDEDPAPQRRAPVEDEEERRPQRRNQDEDDDDPLRGVPLSKKVQDRIGKLTARQRQAERDAQALRDQLTQLQRENQQHVARQMQGDDLIVASREEGFTREEETLERQAKEAFETGNSDVMFKVNKRLAEIASERQRLADVKAYRQQQRAQFEQQQNAPPEQNAPQQPTVTPEAAAWLGKQRDWWGKDDVLTTAAFTIDKQVAADGYEPSDPEYYEELDKRLRKRFPADFAEFDRQRGRQQGSQYEAPANRSRPSQPVSGVSRSPVQGGKRPVVLSASQQRMARNVGLTDQEYAEQLRKMGRA